MRAEWEQAHTDFTLPVQRRAPTSLTDSESDWRHYLETTPNGWLLRRNALTEALVSGQPLYLLHTTRDLNAIRASRQVHVSTGCLVGALYCSPLTAERSGLRPHNLGAYLMDTKPSARLLVFEVTPDAPIRPLGIDYLHLGAVHLRIYQHYRTFLTPAEAGQIDRTVLAGLRGAAGFLDLALRNATGRTTPAPEFVDRLSEAVAMVPFLGYLYFEVLSEYLMLHSTAPVTKALAQAGELNCRLYKSLAFAAVDTMGKLFDLSRFAPHHDRLGRLISVIEPGLAAGAAEYVRRRLSHLLARTMLHPSQDAAAVSFQGAGLGAVQDFAPGLIGQMLFREVRYLSRYRELYHYFEKAKALEAWAFWNQQGIPTPFNGTLPKGEIGIQPAYPRATVRVWSAVRDVKGLLHPATEIQAAITPHLASWWAPPRRREMNEVAA
ncbi:hypothetical protein ACFVGM_08985 [Kitasatospora purpeofusca]|uniref:hypothetical protein n=1 Tax=Kitasatospora purpeofusca TaxID=67352 RepID=UPI003683688D